MVVPGMASVMVTEMELVKIAPAGVMAGAARKVPMPYLLIEDHAVQIFVESNFILFVGFKVQAMPLFHLCPVQLKMFRRPPAGMMIPAIGEQDTADVHKQGRDWCSFFHEAGSGEVW